MSLENARAVYPIMVQLARDLSQRRQGTSPRRLGHLRRPLRPLQGSGGEGDPADDRRQAPQAAPGRSASSKGTARPLRPHHPEAQARGDFGDLLRPTDGWWEPYVAKNMATVGERPLLVQGIPVRPRLRRMARRAVLLRGEDPRMATEHAPDPRGTRTEIAEDPCSTRAGIGTTARRLQVGDFLVMIADQTEEDYLRRWPRDRQTSASSSTGSSTCTQRIEHATPEDDPAPTVLVRSFVL